VISKESYTHIVEKWTSQMSWDVGVLNLA